MTYKVLVKRAGRWQEVGFRHHSAEEAQEAARSSLQGERFLILPAN
jgi:hypothetical protein